MKAHNGGFAFPSQNSEDGCGMTLRDYFAGQALSGLLAASPHMALSTAWHDTAHVAYALADIMLAKRDKET